MDSFFKDFTSDPRKRTFLIAGVVVAGSLFILYQFNKQSDDQLKSQKDKTVLHSEIQPRNVTEDAFNEAMAMYDAMNDADVVVPTFATLLGGPDNDANDDSKTSNDGAPKFPVQVFVRMRPFIKEEIEQKHEEMKYDTENNNNNDNNVNGTGSNLASIILHNVTQSKKHKGSNSNSKKFSGFQSILLSDDDNVSTCNKCILPNISAVFDGNTVCSFAYGHTGSGKTHTMLGYSEHNVPGMYELTAKNLFAKLKELKLDSSIFLEVRFAELYQGKMRDLFSKDLVECHVREDNQNNIHIRGPTIKNEETGEVLIQPLTGMHARTAEEVINFVNNAKKSRNVGSSTKHDESSRSHAFLEFEFVNKELIEARADLILKESELVPHGKARDDEMIFIEGSKFSQDPVTGQYKVDENWKNPDPEKIIKLQKMVNVYEKRVTESMENIENIIKNGSKCLGGTIVFVDLAGNEWGQDSKIRTGKGKDTPQQARERKEINKSLLCLKECIRGLHDKKRTHIPYRDSKLTMVLRPHLKGIKSTAIMIANVSPSQNDIKKTVNTLQYSQLVAQA